MKSCVNLLWQRRKKGLPEWNSRESSQKEMDFQLEEANTYAYPYSMPEYCECKSEGKIISYYKVSPGEVSPHAVYPVVMDNQWCPFSFYADPRFVKEGFASAELYREREWLQRQDIYRGLLHARQLLVNRAYLQNSRIFIRWYKKENIKEYNAFCHLLENGSIVLALYREKIPCEPVAYGNTDWEAWKKLCAEHITYCLRMDWEDESTNEMETDELLGLRFHNYCVTTAEDKYRLEKIARNFLLSENESDALVKKWKEIQKKAVQTRMSFGKNYSREQFYKDHIVKDNSKIVDCVIDEKKPFSMLLKQVIDMKYNLNFAEAYGIKPLISNDTMLDPAMVGERNAVIHAREVSAEELIYAAGSFQPSLFLTDTLSVLKPDLSLDQIEVMRNIPQWQKYIRMIEHADSRAGQWDVDFSYIGVVWQEYQRWMKEVRFRLPELQWKTIPGAVSVIYHLGEKEIYTIYRQGEIQPIIRENIVPVGRGKQTLTIDYICGDILDENGGNCLLTEIRLFKGWTHESGRYMYAELIKRLTRRKQA